MLIRVTLCCGLQHDMECDILKYYQEKSTNAVLSVEILHMSDYEKQQLLDD